MVQLSSRAVVTSIDFYDVIGCGNSQLIVGRDDGFVDLYEIAANDEQVQIPTLIFSEVQQTVRICFYC